MISSPPLKQMCLLLPQARRAGSMVPKFLQGRLPRAPETKAENTPFHPTPPFRTASSLHLSQLLRTRGYLAGEVFDKS